MRGWNPEKKEVIVSSALKKEEGGRHTPFHNKRTTDVTGEIELEMGREMTTGLDVEYRLYGPGQAHWGNARRWQPGQPFTGIAVESFPASATCLRPGTTR